MIIPNGQRPGIIQGLTFEEVMSASSLPNGYRRLMISDHKTGYIQPATIYLYEEAYTALTIFASHVLKKLSRDASDGNRLTGISKVFQTYEGDNLPSSRVTPLFRQALSVLKIEFVETITDVRKATAALTSKYCPEMHDLMSLFQGIPGKYMKRTIEYI